MVKVPIWEQNISDLPGASNVPHATADTFGAQIGKAQESAGKAIAEGLKSLGGALTSQADEQSAISSKTALSDHEAAVSKYEIDLDRSLPPERASEKPKLMQEFATNDWNQRRGSVGGRYQQTADSTVNAYHNRKGVQWYSDSVKAKDEQVERQIDGALERHSNALRDNPSGMPAALDVTRALVAETDRNDFE